MAAATPKQATAKNSSIPQMDDETPNPTSPVKIMAEADRKKFMINESRFFQKSERQMHFIVEAEIGTTLERIMEPEYWVNVAPRVQAGSRIDVHMEDYSAIYEFFVVDCGRSFVKVHLLAQHELEKIDTKARLSLESTEVQWMGAHRKYAVVRKSDNQVLHDKFAKQNEAIKYAVNYEKAF